MTESIPCPTCDKPLLPDSIVCPQCQTRLKKDKTGKHFIGRQAPPPKPVQAPTPPVTHTPPQIHSQRLCPCPACGRHLSPDAKVCPSCGKPNPIPRSLNAAIITSLVIGCLLVFMCGLCSISGNRNTSSPIVTNPPTANPPVTETRRESVNLIRQCAYNPSDMKYLGRVISVGEEGINAYGQTEAGQSSVTINNPEVGAMKVTYPRYLIVKPCN